jgi:hypothetical protein
VVRSQIIERPPLPEPSTLAVVGYCVFLSATGLVLAALGLLGWADGLALAAVIGSAPLLNRFLKRVRRRDGFNRIALPFRT